MCFVAKDSAKLFFSTSELNENGTIGTSYSYVNAPPCSKDMLQLERARGERPRLTTCTCISPDISSSRWKIGRARRKGSNLLFVEWSVLGRSV